MKDRVDKSMGIVTLIVEALAKIKPTEPLRFSKRAAHKKRNCSGNSPAKILASRCACKKHRRTKSSYMRPRSGHDDWQEDDRVRPIRL